MYVTGLVNLYNQIREYRAAGNVRIKRVVKQEIPLQAWTGPYVSRSLRLSDLKTFGT
jgi:hypothetical protein